MSAELIISIISLSISFIIGILTAIANIRISKINNAEAYHKYNKQITLFELQFKDEKWLYNILMNDEFSKYTRESQTKIVKWYKKYLEKNTPILLHSCFDQTILKLGCPGPSGEEEVQDAEDLF